MTDKEIFDLYVAQSENVRALSSAISGIIKDINHQIRKSDEYQISIKTKLLALAYSAWSEAQFVQIFYTPHGFLYSELLKIDRVRNKSGISKAWKYMLALALKKVGDESRNRDLAGRLRTLIRLVDQYIEGPATIRNKIAHGQWIIALNSHNTKENPDLTRELASLDPVLIERMVKVHGFLGAIVRDLVQSPRSGFHNYYWTNIVNLENYLKKTKNWDLTSKRVRLIRKPIARGAHGQL